MDSAAAAERRKELEAKMAEASQTKTTAHFGHVADDAAAAEAARKKREFFEKQAVEASQVKVSSTKVLDLSPEELAAKNAMKKKMFEGGGDSDNKPSESDRLRKEELEKMKTGGSSNKVSFVSFILLFIFDYFLQASFFEQQAKEAAQPKSTAHFSGGVDEPQAGHAASKLKKDFFEAAANK